MGSSQLQATRNAAANAQETLEHVGRLVTGDMRVVEPWVTSLQITPEQTLSSRDDVVGAEMKIARSKSQISTEKPRSSVSPESHYLRVL
jgi:hypothetical protein